MPVESEIQCSRPVRVASKRPIANDFSDESLDLKVSKK